MNLTIREWLSLFTTLDMLECAQHSRKQEKRLVFHKCNLQNSCTWSNQTSQKLNGGERYMDVFFFIDYCKACNADAAAILKQIDTSI